jgi:hypothetical protein
LEYIYFVLKGYLPLLGQNRAEGVLGLQSGDGSREVTHMEDTILLDSSEIVPRCNKCGSDDLLMPDGALSQDDLTDDSLITCGSCGTVFTVTEIVASCETSAAKDFIGGTGTLGDDFPD